MPANSLIAFNSIHRTPDLVRAFGPDGEIRLAQRRERVWEGSGVEVGVSVLDDRVALTLRRAGNVGNVSRLQFRWRVDTRQALRYLGDHWERSYGDLEWRGEVPGRTMPWYFLAHDGTRTHGYGVRTGPAALCFWNADAEGISLWCDVRSGGVPVRLGERTLEIAAVARDGTVIRSTLDPELRPVLAALDDAHFDSEANRRLRAHLLTGAGGDDELTGLLAELDARAEAEAIDETTARELLLRLRERHLRRELPGADGERLKELQAELERVREAAATLV